MTNSIFSNRQLVIATMHGKEIVLKPLLENALGVEIILAENLDTDQWGTFSGEVTRPLDPLATARLKCKHAASISGASLAIANEGSFGAHPVIGFVPADEEILVLIDFENDIEIKVKELSTETNFSGKQIHTLAEAKEFAKQVQFPSHALIIRNAKDETEQIIKGIKDWNLMEEQVINLLQQFPSIYLETDMRAMNNPSRMQVIEKACIKLIQKISQQCPNCSTPGFDVVDVIPGLPCSLCGFATRSTLAYIYQCQKCGQQEEKKFPLGKLQEDPMYCDRCNP
ncbi:MAG: hypothetical protein EAZ12_05920 [Sphingobacteriia bacterium]|nr:MAG: hypothetical protein EAZ12_05920 [Sphingobacteriia bacterium]